MYTQRFENKIVLIIEVSAGMNKPYFLKTEGLEKGTYIRLGRSTMRATIRNIALCKAFRAAGYMEKLGSGFITLFSQYRERRLPTPTVIDGENYIKCILPRKTRATIHMRKA